MYSVRLENDSAKNAKDNATEGHLTNSPETGLRQVAQAGEGAHKARPVEDRVVFVAPNDANQVILPANTSIDEIEVDGNDLVFPQSNGEKVVVTNGALAIPSLFLGDVEIPFQVLATLLQNNDIQVAAGPDGNYTVQRNSVGSDLDDIQIGQALEGSGEEIELLEDFEEQQNPASESTSFVNDDQEAGSGSNVAPADTDTSVTMAEDTVLTGTIVASDVDGNTLTYMVSSNPANGSVVLSGNGYTYTPAADFNGADSFDVLVQDGNGGSDTVTISVTVTPVNDAPVGVDAPATTAEDTVLTGTIVSSDVDGDALIYSVSSNPANGSVVLSGNGYTYTPASNFNGADSFDVLVDDGKGGSDTVTISVTVTPVDDAPVGVDASASTAEDTVLTGTIVASDVDGDALTYLVSSAPANGSVVLSGNGYTYTPAADFNGADSFDVHVDDGNGGSDTVTISVTVTPVNDAPVGVDAPATTAEDTVLTGTIVSSDVDGDALIYSVSSNPANGSVVLSGNGYTYTPASNFNGADSFDVLVDDGKGGSDTVTISVTVTPVDDAPVGVDASASTAEDTVLTGTIVASDVDGDALTYLVSSAPANGSVVLSGNGYTYTPAADFNGADSFDVHVDDGNGGSDTVTINVTVTPVNDAPLGADASASTAEDSVLTGTIVATDVDGDALTYSVSSAPANGSVVLSGNSYTYTSAADFNGADSFDVLIEDGNGGTDTVMISVTVTPVNDAPVGVDASASTEEDTVLTGTIVATDVDGDTLTYSVSSNPANGSVVLSGNGYTYTPAADFDGADSFDVLVEDGNGGTDTVTISVTVTPVNDIPVGVDAPASTAEDTVLTGTIVATDVDGDALIYSVSSAPSNGSVVLSGNGYTYTPAANFNGADSFDVLIEDGNGGTDTVMISVTVTPVNDAPVGVDASASTEEDTVLTGTIVATDVDGDTLTYSVSSNPANGSVVLSGNGYTYTPAADFDGADSFDVLVEDGNGGTDTVTISVTVTPVNDAPVATDDNVSALAHTDEFLINSVTVGYQSLPSITALSDGGFLVTWTGSDDEDNWSNYGVKAQLFDRTGRAVGGEFIVNSQTDGTQTESSIAALSGGGFVVTWQSNDSEDDSSGYGIKAQIFDGAGQTVGDEFLVNSKAHYDQRTPAATGLSNGGFVITWRSDDGEDDTSGFSIKAQIFDANGNTVGGEFRVNSQTYSGQVDPDIAALSNGGFVITWETNDGVDDASDSGIKAQIYDGAGQTLGGEFLVNSQTNDYQNEPSIAALSGGGFVIAWESYDGVQDTSSYGIKAQIYDATGQTVGNEFLVNSKTRWDQRTPVAAGLSNGGFVITWYSADREDDTSGVGIKAQIFDADGQAVGDEILVNSETNSDQYAPSIVALSDGGFVIAWQSYDGVDDGSYTGIKAQIFDANGNPADGDFSGNLVYKIDTATLLSNDTDVDGDVLTVEAVAATSAHGAKVTLNGDGTISFDPTGSAGLQALGQGETLVDTFTYTISDGHGGQSTATVSLTIEGVNDAPVVQAVDAGTVSEDDAVQTIDLLAGQSDIDTSDVLSVANIVVTDENDNAVSFTNHGDGTISIDPQQFDALDDGESRTVTVRYDVSDGTDNVANTATLVVNGATDNTAPVAHDDTVSQVGQSSEFLVNSLTDGYQDNPSVTGLPNGGFVITWNSSDGEGDPDGYGIKAQLFDDTGHAVGDEFLVNSATKNDQNAPSIAALSSGGFVITWQSDDRVDDPSGYGVKAQMFGADGQTVGGEFLVNSEMYKKQDQPSITGLPDGGFVITWRSLDGGDDPSSYSIKAQIYDATGQTVGGEFLVNSEKNSIQSAPSVTALSGGDFVITWHSLDGVDDKSYYGVKARIFDGNGDPAGAEFLVNSETYDGQRYPSITGLSGGGFVITWQSADGVDDKSDNGIKAQLYDATGRTLGAEFLVNSQTDGYQYPPSITALSDGGFVITWPSNDGSGDGIKAQIFDADGQAVGDEFLVNSETNDNQLAPSITALSDGGFVITWHSPDGVDDTSGWGVKAQMFDAHGTPRGGDFSGNLVYTIDTATLLSNDTDVDGDVLTVEAVAATSAHGATVTLNGDGTISFDPTGSAELQALGQGETLVDTFTYTISDGHGGLSTATVSLTIQGVNDAPVVQAVDVTGTITEGFVLSDAGSLTFSDFDLTDRPTASETTVSVSGLGRDGVSTLSLTAAQQSAIETAFFINADAGNSNDGTINWSFNIAETALDFLGEGEIVTATFTITVTDDEGATASQDVTISITGANDAPVVQAVDAGTVSEDAAVQTINLLAGQSDVDASDVLSVDNIVVTDENDNAVSFANHGDGTISIDPQQFDALNDGQSRTVTVRYDVSDGTDNVANTATLVVDGVTDNTAPVANNDTLDPTTEFQVNEHILGTQTGARVAVLPDGGFVTTWASQDGEQGDTDGNAVKVRIFGANGDQPGAEFQANTTTTNDQARPDVAVLSDGRFIVVWQSSDQSVTDHNIIARLFAADGSPLSDEFVVSEYTNEDQLEPRIAVLPDDRVVVTWSSADQQQDTSGFAVKGRTLTTDGTDPLEADGNEYVINYLTSSEQLDSDITVLPDGRVAVTWTSMDHTFGSDLDGSSIRLGFYNPDTGPTGEGIINAFKTGDQTNPAIAALTNGRVVVVWESADHQSSDQSGTAVYARVMTGPGSSVNTTEFLVSQNWDGDQLNPEVTALADGGFVVTWDSVDGQLGDLSGKSMNGRVFEADGTPRTDEFLVNEITQGSQAQPNVVALEDGGFLVVWESNDGQQADNSDYGIKARIFNAYGIERGYGEDYVSTIDGADLLVNDTDADGDSIFISTVSDISHLGATVTLNGYGTISYDPTGASQIQALAIGETAEDTFTYSVSDGQGGTATATVTLTVVGANDAPTVQAINAGSVGEDDAAKTIDLLAGQADPDGDTLSATSITMTDNLGGSVAFTNNGDGTISIDPTQFNDLIGGESRTVTINYDVADGSTTTANTATLVVNGADDFYTAVDDTIDPVTEFRVNTATNSYQQDPDITVLDDGSFVVTWRSNDREQDTSSSGIKARIFNVDGSEKVAEFLVNQHTFSTQYAPVVTTLADGGFVVVWHSNDKEQGDTSATAVKARIFDADGSARSAEFLVNEFTHNYQEDPSVTALPDGNFVIGWYSYAQGLADTSSSALDARVFDANGNAVEFLQNGTPGYTEFLVNSQTNGSQRSIDIATLQNGGFVATWHSLDGEDDSSSYGVKARIFNADGSVGNEFLVNTLTVNSQKEPAVAVLSNGKFVITWQSNDQTNGDSEDYGIMARIFNADSTPVNATEFPVNQNTVRDQSMPQITALAGGGFVITWESNDIYDPAMDDDSSSLRGRVFDAAGNGGTEFLINEFTTREQEAAKIAGLPDGGFVVTWQSYDREQGDDSSLAVKARIFNADGTERGISEDIGITIDKATLLPNDTGVDPSETDIISVSATSAHGAVVTLNGDGTIFYDPSNAAEIQSLDGGESLEDSFTYAIDDGHGGQSTATVTLTVSGADENTPPVAVADFAGSGEVGEYGVNSTTAGNQGLPNVAGLPGGNYVVTWDDPNLGILAQLFDAHGNRVGDEFTVQDTLRTNEGNPVAKALSDGTFVIAWEAADESSIGIYAQHFAADGGRIDSEFQVNTQTNDKQSAPDIAALENGGFIVTWYSYDGFGDQDGSSIKAQRYDADGQPVGSELQVNTTETEDQSTPDVVSLSDGSFIITWASLEGDAQGLGSMLKAQRFDEDGNKLGAEITLRDGSVSSDYYPDIDLLDNGNLAITYRSQNSYSLTDDIRAQIIDSDGNTVVNEFVVSTNNASLQFTPHLTALDNGGFVVSWYSGDGVQDQDALGQKIRIYNANGVAQTDEILVNDHDAGYQLLGVPASVENGFVITWVDSGGDIDGDGDAIRAKIYNNDGTERGVDQVLETGSVTINVLANDTDIDGDTLSIVGLDTSGTLGRVVDNHDGTLTYDASASAALWALSGDETETDTFSYTVSDGNGGTATASVSVLVNGVTNNIIPINIDGGDTDDIFTSFSGKTVMTGDGGADTFVLDTDALSNVGLADVVTDYSLSEGDQVDVSALLSNVLGHEASTAEDLAKLSVLTHGSDTFVKVDGHDVVTLQNYSGAVKLIYDDQDHVVTVDAS